MVSDQTIFEAMFMSQWEEATREEGSMNRQKPPGNPSSKDRKWSLISDTGHSAQLVSQGSGVRVVQQLQRADIL